MLPNDDQSHGFRDESWDMSGEKARDNLKSQKQQQHSIPASTLNEDLERALKALEDLDPDLLPDVPRPRAPTNFAPAASASWRLDRIQKYIGCLEYNHTGKNYFKIRKDRGAKRLAGTAREIIRESLPIKCIEAVFLGFYLTLGMTDIVRIPLRFQSSVEQNGRFVFKHIVLAVGHKGRWGAIGLSRKETLMHRKLQFESLAELIKDFHFSYGELGHSVQHVGIGLPFGHCEHSMEPIYWRPFMIEFGKRSAQAWNDQVENAINSFVSKLDVIGPFVTANEGDLPKWFLEQHPIVKRSGTAVKSSKKAGLNRSESLSSIVDTSDQTVEESKDDEVDEASHDIEELELGTETDEVVKMASAKAAASTNKSAHLEMNKDGFLAAREPIAPNKFIIPALSMPSVSIPTLDGKMLQLS